MVPGQLMLMTEKTLYNIVGSGFVPMFDNGI